MRAARYGMMIATEACLTVHFLLYPAGPSRSAAARNLLEGTTRSKPRSYFFRDSFGTLFFDRALPDDRNSPAEIPARPPDFARRALPSSPSEPRSELIFEFLGLPSSERRRLRRTIAAPPCGSIAAPWEPRKSPIYLISTNSIRPVAFFFASRFRSGRPAGQDTRSADRVRPSIEGEHMGRKSIFPVDIVISDRRSGCRN